MKNRLLVIFCMSCLTAWGQSSGRVKIEITSAENFPTSVKEGGWATKIESKYFHVDLIKSNSNVASPYAVETDEVDSFLWVSITDIGTKKSDRKIHYYKIGPFFAPKLFGWADKLNHRQTELILSYYTKEKKYGSLSIFPNKIQFKEGIRKASPVRINVPDNVITHH